MKMGAKVCIAVLAVLLVLSGSMNVLLLIQQEPAPLADGGTQSVTDSVDMSSDESPSGDTCENDGDMITGMTSEAGGQVEVGPEEYSITQPFVYPDKSSDEWRSMNQEQRRKACEIPEDTMGQMTTQALLESVLSNPFLIDLSAFDTLEMGVEVAGASVSGLQTLVERPDFMETIIAYGAELMPDMMANEDAQVRSDCDQLMFRMRIVRAAYYFWNAK